MSTVEKMTIHRALAELKTLDARINRAINDATYVLAVKHTAEKISGMTVNNFKDNMESSYQKITDLIKRRDAMKRAVVLSNATTMVKIGDKEMTVAEAINMHQSGMELKAELLRQMKAAYAQAQKELDRNSGETLEKKAEQYVLSVINAQPKDSKMTVNDDAMKALRKTYIENNTYDLIDPLGITKIIESLDNEINEFNAEVDAVLSCSNALTVIEFEY